MEMGIVKYRIKERSSAMLALQLRHGIASEGKQLALDVKGVPHQIAPGSPGQVATKWHSIQEESQEPLTILYLRTTIQHHPGEHVGVAAQ